MIILIVATAVTAMAKTDEEYWSGVWADQGNKKPDIASRANTDFAYDGNGNVVEKNTQAATYVSSSGPSYAKAGSKTGKKTASRKPTTQVTISSMPTSARAPSRVCINEPEFQAQATRYDKYVADGRAAIDRKDYCGALADFEHAQGILTSPFIQCKLEQRNSPDVLWGLNGFVNGTKCKIAGGATMNQATDQCFDANGKEIENYFAKATCAKAPTEKKCDPVQQTGPTDAESQIINSYRLARNKGKEKVLRAIAFIEVKALDKAQPELMAAIPELQKAADLCGSNEELLNKWVKEPDQPNEKTCDITRVQLELAKKLLTEVNAMIEELKAAPASDGKTGQAPPEQPKKKKGWAKLKDKFYGTVVGQVYNTVAEIGEDLFVDPVTHPAKAAFEAGKEGNWQGVGTNLVRSIMAGYMDSMVLSSGDGQKLLCRGLRYKCDHVRNASAVASSSPGTQTGHTDPPSPGDANQDVGTPGTTAPYNTTEPTPGEVATVSGDTDTTTEPTTGEAGTTPEPSPGDADGTATVSGTDGTVATISGNTDIPVTQEPTITDIGGSLPETGAVTATPTPGDAASRVAGFAFLSTMLIGGGAARRRKNRRKGAIARTKIRAIS